MNLKVGHFQAPFCGLNHGQVDVEWSKLLDLT